MVELAQSEIAGKLPKLLDKLDKQSVVICRDGKQIGAIVSMDLFDELKEMQLARMREISTEAGERVAEHAAELGITSEELIDRLLSDED
jgi:PHD/YefM family antitoxin component YafN of YafNO toxin-antitoxin module